MCQNIGRFEELRLELIDQENRETAIECNCVLSPRPIRFERSVPPGHIVSRHGHFRSQRLWIRVSAGKRQRSKVTG